MSESKHESFKVLYLQVGDIRTKVKAPRKMEGYTKKINEIGEFLIVTSLKRLGN